MIFVAGSTGAVGQEVVKLAAARGTAIFPHRRKGPDGFDLGDRARLDAALAGCDAIVQLIGTMRNRFASGDTYETSDIGTTRTLCAAAGGRHIVLLSSVGAGRPVGAYLKAKAEAERLVRESGCPWTIVRPSAFVGEGRKPPPLFGGITRALGLDRWRPIRVEEVAAVML